MGLKRRCSGISTLKSTSKCTKNVQFGNKKSKFSVALLPNSPSPVTRTLGGYAYGALAVSARWFEARLEMQYIGRIPLHQGTRYQTGRQTGPQSGKKWPEVDHCMHQMFLLKSVVMVTTAV